MRTFWQNKFKRNLQSLKIALVLTIFLYLTPALQGHIADGKGLGFNLLSQEQMQYAEDNWHAIVEVKTNKIGMERIKNHREETGQHPLFQAPAHHAEELVLVKGQSNVSQHQDEAASATSALPSSVDNSQLPSFPPIGDQKQLGSCVAWGTTYYQATHEYGLLNGINNKTSTKNVFSPKWTYNNLNGGVDGGLYIFETYQLFSQNGIVSIDRLPYDSNYRTWDLNPQDWVSAISYRTGPGQLIAGIGGTQQNLQVIKQLLNNGHILTFGTYIGSWKMTKVKNDPTANSPHAGELAASWMSGTNGGHCMTIVGYDDNVWIDVNNDGKVDAGEKGAFLVANSWSEGWGNKGFVWIAYDAFLTKSAVVNGPSYNRVAIADAMNSYVVSAVPIAQNYAPKMYAQFTLTQTVRDQISVAVGISDTKSKKPTKVFNSYALHNQGGGYEFDGTAPYAAETATFALDLTDLLSAVPGSNKRFYLIIGDNSVGHPTTVQSFSIVDNVNNHTVKSPYVPLTVDNGNGLVYVDYDPSTLKSNESSVGALPVLKITSPHAGQVAEKNLWLAATASDAAGIERVDFYIDSVLFATDETAPYYVMVATQKLLKGAHELTAIAYNKNGDSTSETVHFRVIK